MIGSARILLELILEAGLDPAQSFDTDEPTPAMVYEDLVAAPVQYVTIGPADALIPIVIPASCLVFIAATSKVTLRLATGETPQEIRYWMAGAPDSSGTAVPARTILLSGNAEVASRVAIYSFTKAG